MRVATPVCGSVARIRSKSPATWPPMAGVHSTLSTGKNSRSAFAIGAMLTLQGYSGGVAAHSSRARLRELLARKNHTVLAPGGFSPLLARMVELVGFEAFFLAGSQTSAFLYALPDVGIMGLRDMVDHARHVAARTTIPILADAD